MAIIHFFKQNNQSIFIVFSIINSIIKAKDLVIIETYFTLLSILSGSIFPPKS